MWLASRSGWYSVMDWTSKQRWALAIPMYDRKSKSKLIQVLMSILAGCETLSEVTSILKQEKGLATIWGWEHFADQSSLSRTLDEERKRILRVCALCKSAKISFMGFLS
jgi:hypothetical protein